MSGKSAVPLLLAGGAAVFLLAGKKKHRTVKSGKVEPTSYDPYTPGAEGSPAPPAEPSKPTAKKESDLLEPIVIEGMLNDLGYPPGAIDGAYDSDTVAAIEAFQIDWNYLMEWLYKHNPNITPSEPNYDKILEDGKWGPQTEARAVRALDTVPANSNASVSIGGVDYPVSNFREMVITCYEVKPV